MTGFTALYDACVLYPFHLRDLLIQLATTGLFRARWSADIDREWIDALCRDKGDDKRPALERVRDRMREAVPDCLVTGYEPLVAGLVLPDPDDRHVLAAAIRGRTDVIVTINLTDFPAEALAPHDVQALHPDDFILRQAELSANVVVESAKRCRGRMLNPPRSAEEYLDILRRQGLPTTADFLYDWRHVI